MYFFQVSPTYWASYGNVVCLRSDFCDWFLILIRWNFHSFCYHCIGILQWYVPRQLVWLLLATYICHWLSTLYSSLVMWHCFMEVYETERWYRHNPVQLRNWTSNPKYFWYHHSGSVVSVLTLFVETLNLLLCKHSGAHSQTLCKCKIQVFALGFICSLHEQITSTIMIFDIPELMWLWKYAI